MNESEIVYDSITGEPIGTINPPQPSTEDAVIDQATGQPVSVTSDAPTTPEVAPAQATPTPVDVKIETPAADEPNVHVISPSAPQDFTEPTIGELSAADPIGEVASAEEITAETPAESIVETSAEITTEPTQAPEQPQPAPAPEPYEPISDTDAQVNELNSTVPSPNTEKISTVEMPKPEPKTSKKTIIISISVLVVAAIITFLTWQFFIKPNTETPSGDTGTNQPPVDTFGDLLGRIKSENSTINVTDLRSQSLALKDTKAPFNVGISALLTEITLDEDLDTTPVVVGLYLDVLNESDALALPLSTLTLNTVPAATAAKPISDPATLIGTFLDKYGLSELNDIPAGQNLKGWVFYTVPSADWLKNLSINYSFEDSTDTVVLSAE